MKIEAQKLKEESPVRLRECLTALSQACGHDVYRCELVVMDGSVRAVITCSKAEREEAIAKTIGAALSPWLSTSARLKIEGERYEYRIVDICETLHMAGNGSGDGLAPTLRASLIGKLKARLDGWHKSPKFSERYDNAIRELIEATLEEVGRADP
jgi:hypothetical protein